MVEFGCRDVAGSRCSRAAMFGGLYAWVGRPRGVWLGSPKPEMLIGCGIDVLWSRRQLHATNALAKENWTPAPFLIRRRQRALLSQKMKPGDRGDLDLTVELMKEEMIKMNWSLT